MVQTENQTHGCITQRFIICLFRIIYMHILGMVTDIKRQLGSSTQPSESEQGSRVLQTEIFAMFSFFPQSLQ